MAKDTEKTGGDDAASLKAALEAAEKRAAKAEAKLADVAASQLNDADAELIAAKVAVGLTREQAVEVVKSQKAHDARLAKAA